MQIKKILENKKIIGIVSTYKSSLENDCLVKDLPIKNSDKALVMVGLNQEILEKKIKDLTLNEQLKVDLAMKLHNDIIVIGNLANSLNNKDYEYIRKLLLKLNNDYHKKIVIIDQNVEVFLHLVKQVVIVKGKEVLYTTSNFFDDELYKYTKMPPIVEFIKYVNKDYKRLQENTDIYELIKDIYRSVS